MSFDQYCVAAVVRKIFMRLLTFMILPNVFRKTCSSFKEMKQQLLPGMKILFS